MATSTAQNNDVDRVRDATDLVRLIGEHVALTPRGREYVGLCPFHDDRRPSLAVVTHKGHAFYNCFACGASGDCFRFVMAYHKMDFGEALRFLADRAGVTLTPRSRSGNRGDSTGQARRSELLDAVASAEAWFRRNYADPGIGAEARRAVEARGITDDMTERFALGAAPARFDGLLAQLGGDAQSIDVARAAGLLKSRSDGSGCYDAFRNRLIFPITDDVGRTIAFGGRILDPEDRPKYLNSAESPIFRKSRTLYGLAQAKRAIIDERVAVVTEGYTDVIACHQAGVLNVVGTLGTALTREHAGILTRLCDTVVLVFDGDEAGRKAADRGVEVFFAEPVDIKICVLPDGDDPDDLLRRADGAERFRAAVDAAVGALEFKLDRFAAGLGGASGLSARQRHLEQFLAELADLGFGALQGVRKALVITRLADLLGLSIPEIETALGAVVRTRRRAAPAVATPDPVTEPSEPMLTETLGGSADRPASRRRRLAEHDLLAVLLFEPSAAAEITIATGAGEEPLTITSIFCTADFADPAARRLAEVVLPLLEAGTTFSMRELLGRLDGEDLAAMASRLFFEGQRTCGSDETAAADAIHVAAAALDDCIGRERYHARVLASRGVREVTVEADTEDGGGDSASVLDQIKERQQQGYLPGAIPHGVRS